MSTLIVEVCEVQKVLPHPNADRLELAQIKGWQCVVPRGRYAAGDRVVYVPPDSVLPEALGERLGVAKYLSKGRVRCARLRGEPSFGLIVDNEGVWPVGTDVASHYGITKWVPPVRPVDLDALPDHGLFPTYTDVENMRNFPDVFSAGETIVASEKIHGTNCRVGLVRGSSDAEGMWVCGSKKVRRAVPEKLADSLYSYPLSLEPVRAMLTSLGVSSKQVVLFGEVYGKVQSLRYGVDGQLAFRAFDLYVDGKYLDAEEFAATCDGFGVLRVPVLYQGSFDLAKIREISDGPSAVPGATNIREGVVVRPARERTDPKIGRAVLKYVGDEYLFGDVSDSDEV